MRPLIGITVGFESKGEEAHNIGRLTLPAAYSDAVWAAGGLPYPLPLPPGPSPACFADLLARVDGLLFSGGPDLDPRHYGQPRHPKSVVMPARRGDFEVELFRRADAARVPILAICLGFQVAHVARGGRLIQHVDDLRLAPPVTHHPPTADGDACHPVRIEAGSRLAGVAGSLAIEVNSRHHQAVDPAHLGRGLRSVAWSPDGLIEGSEDTDGRFLLAVQWHPENLIDRPEHLRLFQALVDAAGKPRASPSR